MFTLKTIERMLNEALELNDEKLIEYWSAEKEVAQEREGVLKELSFN